MSKPDGIPDDVWEAAFTPGREACVAVSFDAARVIVARAILAERNRCLNVIGSYADHPNEVVGMVADEIYSAIRHPQETTNG